MEQIEEILKELNLNNQLTLEDIPQIDLYIDQVIQLFENQYEHTVRNKQEKVLTKTMINNYAKGKLFFPIRSKKYSKDHLMLINFIYQMKGALSINDIKKTLDGINNHMGSDEFELDLFYEKYIEITENHVENFKKQLTKIADTVDKATLDYEEDYLIQMKKILLITSLTNMSNYYRRVAEKLIDDIDDEDLVAGKKKKDVAK